MNQTFSTDEERLAFILDEDQPDDLKLPLIGQISDDRVLITIIGTLKISRRFVSEKEHKEVVLAAARAVRDGKLLEEAAKGFREGTRYEIYPILVEKCPGYTPLYIINDQHARSECKREAFEAVRAQAARDHNCLYITSEQAGEQWFHAKMVERLHMVYADTDPYMSIAGYMACEPGVLVDEEDGRLVLWESAPGAFRELYQGWQCVLYSVPEVLFLKEPTNWETTRVCTDIVPVVREEKIEDAWQTLTAGAREGLCVIHEYSDGKEYKANLGEVSERIRLRNEKPLFIIENGTLVQYAKDDNYVEELVVPDGVERIGWRAFYGLWGIERVRLPASVRIIEEEAFYGCHLSEIEIPEGVTTIEAWAFGDCGALQEVKIPDSVESIGSWAFGYRRNYRFYHDPAPIDRTKYRPLITLIGKKGGEAQRYAEVNDWYECSQIAAFREEDQ